MGQEIAKRLNAFNVRIVAVDRKNVYDNYVKESYLMSNIKKAIKKIYRKYRIERLKMLIIKSKIEIKSFV